MIQPLSGTENKKAIIIGSNSTVVSQLRQYLDELKVTTLLMAESGEMAIKNVGIESLDFMVFDIPLNGYQKAIGRAEGIYHQLNIPIVFVIHPSDADSLFQEEPTLPFGYVLKPVEGGYLKIAINMAFLALRKIQNQKQFDNTPVEDIPKYWDVIDNSSDAIYVIQDGKYKLYNRTFYESLGYLEDEIRQVTFDRLIHPDDREKVVQRYVRRLSGDEMGEISVFKVVAKNGEVIWVENKSVVIEWDGQSATLNFSSNITERRAAEEALKSSENEFRSIVESSPMGMHLYQLEPDGRLVFSGSNPAADKILGVANAQFIGKTIEEAFPPLANTEVPDRYRKAAMDGIPWYTEQIEYQDDQIVGAFEVRAFQMSPGKMAVFFFDITHRKQTEDALKTSEGRFRQLAENIREVFWIIKPDISKFYYISPAVSDIFQMDVQEVYANPLKWVDFVIKEDRRKVLTVIEENRGKDFENMQLPEFRILRPDGEERWISAQAFPVRNESGEIYRIAGVAEDITERKKTQELMIQTEKMMSVAGMAAGMAHEINNPLGSIMQSAQNIQRRFSPDLENNFEVAVEYGIDLHAVQSYMEKRNIDKFIEGIRASGKRAAKIIEDMLQFSRKSESDMAPTDINETIDVALTLATQDFDLSKKYDFLNIAHIIFE